MAVPTFLIGIQPGYQTLGVMAPVLLTALRVIQGLSGRRRMHHVDRLHGRARAVRPAGRDRRNLLRQRHLRHDAGVGHGRRPCR
jgi:hypothetical protein